MTDYAMLQSTLAQAGRDPGPVDGQLGPRTIRALLSVVAGGKLPTGRLEALAAAMAEHLPDYAMTPRLRLIHFVGQLALESGGWRYMEELGGPAYCAKYDGRKDLGNVRPGDGYRYKGRGPIQITGRFNYGAYGKRLALDLLEHPERAADPDVGIRIACLYWTDHGLNAYADRDDGRAISRAINRGNARSRLPANHEAERLANVAKLKTVWPAEVRA